MHPSILSSLLLLSPALTRAASVTCAIDFSSFGASDNPVPVAEVQCLISAFQSKSFGDSFTLSSIFSGPNTDVSFGCGRFRICARNSFFFAGTTISSEEMVSATQMIDCGTKSEEPGNIKNIQKGLVTGIQGWRSVFLHSVGTRVLMLRFSWAVAKRIQSFCDS
jgi:hypothetical protein